VKQKLLTEVAVSLSNKIRKRENIGDQEFATACQTFIQVVAMIHDEEPPWVKEFGDMRRVMGLVQTQLGIN
jgi:hypothetical protein